MVRWNPEFGGSSFYPGLQGMTIGRVFHSPVQEMLIGQSSQVAVVSREVGISPSKKIAALIGGVAAFTIVEAGYLFALAQVPESVLRSVNGTLVAPGMAISLIMACAAGAMTESAIRNLLRKPRS